MNCEKSYGIQNMPYNDPGCEVKTPITLQRCMERLGGLIGRMSENNGMAAKLAEELCGSQPEGENKIGGPSPMPDGVVNRFDDLLNDLQKAIDTNAHRLGRVISKIG